MREDDDSSSSGLCCAHLRKGAIHTQPHERHCHLTNSLTRLPSSNRQHTSRDAAANTKAATLVVLRVMRYHFTFRKLIAEGTSNAIRGRASHGASGYFISDAPIRRSALRHCGSVRGGSPQVGAPRQALRRHGGHVVPDGHCSDGLVCRARAWCPRDCSLHPERRLLLHTAPQPFHDRPL